MTKSGDERRKWLKDGYKHKVWEAWRFLNYGINMFGDEAEWLQYAPYADPRVVCLNQWSKK